MTQREKELTEQVERLTKLVNALVQELAEAKAEILVHDSLENVSSVIIYFEIEAHLRHGAWLEGFGS